MKKVRAYSCTRGGSIGQSGSAVCFLLDTAHASHTLRTFLRDRGEGAVLKPISDADARRLLSDAAPETDTRVRERSSA
jgi:hypothetical protein